MSPQQNRDLVFDQNFLDDLKFWVETNRKTAIRLLSIVEGLFFLKTKSCICYYVRFSP